MPEGDTIAIAARRLAPFVGVPLELQAPHPRVAALRLERRLAGVELARVDTLGKHLLLRFANGLALHVHLRMSGRIDVHARGAPWARAASRAWLVLRTPAEEAVLFDGPVLELLTEPMISLHPVLRRLGPDVLGDGFEADAVLRRLRAADQGRAVGDALLDQRLVAGVGNVWRSEALHAHGIAPQRTLAATADDDLRALARWLAAEMAQQVERGGIRPVRVYGREGRPCPRCGAPVASVVLGDDGRRAFWCPRCQPR
jgi:endonuclease-8